MKEQIIELLVSNLGYSILEIDEQIYIVHEFVEADNQVNKHKLRGKNITEIFNNFVSNNNFNKDIILTKQETLPIITKYFHHSYKYILTRN